MNVQVIMRDGEAEYAVLPWSEYQALLEAAGIGSGAPAQADTPVATPAPPSPAQLSALREAQGLSLEQLAKSVGISPSYLGMIERGEREPDSAIRRALARALGFTEWGA